MVAHDAAFLDRAEQDSVLDCYDVLDRVIGEVEVEGVDEHLIDAEVELFALLATVRPDRPINFDRLATLLAQTTGEPPSSDQSRPASRTCVASSATAQAANHSSPIAEQWPDPLPHFAPGCHRYRPIRPRLPTGQRPAVERGHHPTSTGVQPRRRGRRRRRHPMGHPTSATRTRRTHRRATPPDSWNASGRRE
jgi:hypothetical protein